MIGNARSCLQYALQAAHELPNSQQGHLTKWDMGPAELTDLVWSCCTATAA